MEESRASENGAARRRKSHIFEKEQDGHYVDQAWCSQRLFEDDDFGPAGSLIFDPACGWGTILRSAAAAGFRTYGADVVPRWKSGPWRLRGTVLEQRNFLNSGTTRLRPMSIVCNPPFDHVEEFCLRALSVAKYKVAMLCLLRRLPAARWLQELPLETIYVLTPRPSMPPGDYIAKGNKPGGGTQDFVWLVFNNQLRGSLSLPAFRWLHRDGRK